MKPLSIEATETTPAVTFDPARRELRFQGESYPENVATFYEPILAWLREYQQQPQALHLVLDLRYFNTSSSKYLFDLFLLLEDAQKAGAEVAVTWRYQEGVEVMQENGEEFAEDFALPFTFDEYPATAS